MSINITFNPLPRYFYFKWDNCIDNIIAEWRNTRCVPPLNNLKVISTVKWNDLNKLKVHICTNYQSDQDLSYTYTNNPYTNKSYLKSHLQKCIRRSDTWKTIKTSYHLMNLDATAFLRRLTIIAIEDALPLKGYSILVWLTSAVSNGYQLSEAQRCWCYGYAVELAKCKYRDIVSDVDRDLPDFNLANRQVHYLPQAQQDLIYSLIYRKSYGGMRGDKRLINALAHKWHRRFIQNKQDWMSNYLNSEIKMITPPSEELELNEWNPAAIDYHCIPQMIYTLLEAYDEFTDDEIRHAIWHHSSSITNKHPLEPEPEPLPKPNTQLLAVWRKIRKRFTNMAQYYLQLNH